MNRSILIVICDFLLVSLLAFSSIDSMKMDNAGAEPQIRTEMATNPPDAKQDLGSAMRLALQDERKQREHLQAELSNAHDTAGKQLALLNERDKQIQNFEQEIQTHEQAAQKLQTQQTNLLQQIALAQTNIQTLNQQLAHTSKQYQQSTEQRAALLAEELQQSKNLAALQSQLSQLSQNYQQLNQSNQNVLDEKQRLAAQLQVAEAERRAALERAARSEEQVMAEREEKARLAEGVKTLAAKSGKLEQEIRENRALSPNVIYSMFLTNRVSVRFYAARSTVFGIDRTRDNTTDSIFVTDGTNTCAVSHVKQAPFTFSDPGLDWELTASMTRGGKSFPIQSLSFFKADPRILFMPISDDQLSGLGSAPYKVSANPYRFQDAVLIGANGEYYGECKFQIDAATPQYLKMDRSTLRGLFGKFNPTSGDLAFSKNGDLLGVMANNTFCLLIKDFIPAATFKFGHHPDQSTGDSLARLYNVTARMPYKLQ